MQDDTYFARLVSLACHDLRTPLATVHGFAATLTRTAELAPPVDRYVEMIEQASTQMAELLDELALVSRIAAGRDPPTPPTSSRSTEASRRSSRPRCGTAASRRSKSTSGARSSTSRRSSTRPR